MAEMQRRYDLFGYRRFMLHLPAGREIEQRRIPLPSSQWHVLDSAGIEPRFWSVRSNLQLQLTGWLQDKPDVQVLIYQGLRFDPDFLPQPWLERGNMDPAHAVVPELTNLKHRVVVQQNTLGWLTLSPSPRPFRSGLQIGFAFDNTGVPGTRDALVAVVEDATLFGNDVRPFVSGEAIPHTAPTEACGEAELISAYTTRAPWFAMMDVHQRFDQDQSWTVLPRQHLGFGVRNVEYRLVHDEDGSCQVVRDPQLTPLRDSEVRAAICSAYQRGFVIIHYGGDHDAYVRYLYGTRPDSCP
jgi:hypothetical protein